MMAGKQQLTESGISCPMCWTPIAIEDMQSPVYALDVLTFGFQCETCGNAFISSYEKIGDKAAWKSRILM